MLSTSTHSTQKLTAAEAISLAQTHFQANEWAACQYVCERIKAAMPTHPLAHHLLGLVAYRLGRVEEALDHLQTSVRLAPQDPMVLANTVEVLRGANKVAEAIELGQRAIKAAPGMATAHSNLALAHYDNGDLDTAKALHAKALELEPSHVASLNNLGSIARDKKDLATAAKTYRNALHLDPGNLEVRNNLTTVLIEMDQVVDAQVEVSRILKDHPNDVEALVNQARIHLARLELDAAEVAFRKALAVNPASSTACLGLSQTLLEKSHPQAAQAAAEEALKGDPANPGTLHQMGVCCSALSKPDGAWEFYSRALERDQNFKPSLIGRAHLHMELGEMEQARADFEKVHRIDPSDISPLIGLSRIDRCQTREDPVFRALERQLPNVAAMSPMNQIAYRFGLADCYDGLGLYDEAFEQYALGAALKRSTVHYDAEARDRQVDAIIECFTRDYIEALRPFANPSACPIFVLGMPRSGTTLTETILASHPDVFGAGELPDLQRVFGFEGCGAGEVFPVNLKGLGGANLAARAANYLGRLRSHSAGHPRITDKMPSNFNLIGLIHGLLPNAKIVHVRRNGMDTCLSCFTRLFERSQLQSYDLIELGRYYNGYRRLMNHWESVLPAKAIYTVDYQTFVDDPENQTRALLASCGLAWNDACLEFHTTKRRVKTASIAQVRKPIYKSSVEKWRRYEKHLTPLAAVIGT